MKTTKKNHPFGSKQLKEMADQLEGYSVQNLSLYHEAASNTRNAREALMSLIRDDETPRRVLGELHDDSMVESRIRFLQERRRCEKERLEKYVDTEERAIAARRMQHDKET
jgi:undecaprenyl pyrophosphate synthase